MKGIMNIRHRYLSQERSSFGFTKGAQGLGDNLGNDAGDASYLWNRWEATWAFLEDMHMLVQGVGGQVMQNQVVGHMADK